MTNECLRKYAFWNRSVKSRNIFDFGTVKNIPKTNLKIHAAWNRHFNKYYTILGCFYINIDFHVKEIENNLTEENIEAFYYNDVK